MKACFTTIIFSGLLLLGPGNKVMAKESQSYLNSTTNQSADATNAAKRELSIFSKSVSFELPIGWNMAFNSSKGNMYKAEFVPAGESLNNWSDLFCIQGFEGLAENIEPERFLNNFASTYQDSCQGEVVYEQLGKTQMGGQEAYHGIIGCTVMANFLQQGGSVKQQGEIGYYAVIKGVEDLYFMHKSMRGDVFNKNSAPLKSTNHRQFMSNFKQLRF
ncbi:hypothetical protein [Shewanella sp. 10N.286.52.B9]|uniref:hypothetical protein n=2 Tax=unclassified Shewanella TaxID=196818 RepID=UPI000C84FB0E|nr:hypothetical protein [Shewanella sp. 10N.286.52.B9]MDO6776827.1 hypothetical protein [Shewanella sp. 3_MG-2023]PMG29533.1 hypothetical protein BCU94_13175 [Shewanella sp. 10N.286.52.C2]PMH84575.1 hypothetical protein BCU57_17390 [Shewanella sp. 10N.286.48.B5]PMI00061.1 hypothetical protein BCU55_13560 [Shewanella sp. 10N.286.48.A6]PMG50106.1 hypothetical protein BCU91_17725 [Shewanella sp. 10N.286.52.B9]